MIAQARDEFPVVLVVALSIVAITGLWATARYGPGTLEPFLGERGPIAVGLLVCVVGGFALYYLQRRWNLAIFAAQRVCTGMCVAVGAAIPFMLSVTLADVYLRFPEDMHVPLWLAVSFYPSIGYIAQLALHVIPLATTLFVTQHFCRSWTDSQSIWFCVVLVSTIEAAFQSVMTTDPAQSAWLKVFVATHLFLFGVAELVIFRRLDFVSMVVFRFTYYLYWHIIWANARLGLLF